MTVCTTAAELQSFMAERCPAPRFSNVRQCKVQIGKHQFQGCFYHTNEVFQATERACTENRVTAGEPRLEYCLYLLGRLPKSLHDKHIFQWMHGFPVDERVKTSIGEWGLSFYMDEYDNLPEHQKQYHPGNAFGLCDYSPMSYGYYAGQKIDHYEPKPYIRVPMTVEFLE